MNAQEFVEKSNFSVEFDGETYIILKEAGDTHGSMVKESVLRAGGPSYAHVYAFGDGGAKESGVFQVGKKLGSVEDLEPVKDRPDVEVTMDMLDAMIASMFGENRA